MHLLAVWFANGQFESMGVSQRVVPPHVRVAFLVGIFLNTPLIVLYPLTLSYVPSLPLGVVNALLHGWLTLAWGMQWWALEKYCEAYGPLFKAKLT